MMDEFWVSRMTLGTAQLGMPYGVANCVGKPTAAQARRILALALDSGVRSFDTAPAYGDSETQLGEFFRRHGRPADVTITTKLPGLYDQRIEPYAVADAVARAVDRSCEALGVDCLDNYLLHSPTDLRVYSDELVNALDAQITAGRVRQVGVSVYSPADVERALRYSVFRSIQFPKNIFDQRLANCGMLSRLKSAGVTTFARSAFLQGLFALDPVRLPAHLGAAKEPLMVLRRLIEPFGWSPLDVALGFVAAFAEVDSIVVGVETPQQFRENLARLNRRIPAGLMDELKRQFSAVSLDVIDPSRWQKKVG